MNASADATTGAMIKAGQFKYAKAEMFFPVRVDVIEKNQCR